MSTELRRSGIENVGDVPWGTHFCHFYETKDDLLDILIPYFRTGLQDNELCVWVVFDPLDPETARKALVEASAEAEKLLGESQIEIVPHARWYLREGVFDLEQVIAAWKKKQDEALSRGYEGLRVNGNEAWLTEEDWKDFSEYERKLNDLIVDQKMMVLCTYPISVSRAVDIFEVARTHQFVLARRNGRWEVIESAVLAKTKAELGKLNKELEQRVAERTRELEESNIALKVLIGQYKSDQREFEDTIASNVRGRVLPYLEKLKNTRLGAEQAVFVEILERALQDITSPFMKDITSRYPNFTPKELEIIGLIKEGKTTKEIAEILHIGKRTVDSHRDNIRTKLGIADKKVNLRTYLLAMKHT